MVDSYFSGTVFEGARALPPAAVTRATTLPVRQFLTSGDAGQTVSDDGTFRKLFLRALRGEERVDANGDGFITASEMGLVLGDRVSLKPINMPSIRLGNSMIELLKPQKRKQKNTHIFCQETVNFDLLPDRGNRYENARGR